MCFCKFLASLLLLLLLTLCCRTTKAQPPTSLSPSPSPSPSPGGLVPEYEVSAVNDLLRLSEVRVPTMGDDFSSTDCVSKRIHKAVRCKCDSTVCRVTEIDLSGEDLTGRIPDTIGVLSQLEYLYLSENNLSGSIPSSFGNLSRLSELWLYNNLLNGSIPREFGTLSWLQYLDISNNLLSGRIPIELGNISSLIRLYLYDNLLSGQLPPHLGNLSNLEVMSLSNNQFSGALPSSFGKLEKMVYFYIQGNSITGIIPDSISNWRGLRRLRLLGNKFDGPLPSNISTLRNLTYLAANDLGGGPGGFSFPKIPNTSFLRTLILRNCSLTDKIPDYIWQLPALNYLDLSFNNLTGGIPALVKHPYPQNISIGGSTSAVVTQPLPNLIFLRRNKLNGSLPGWMLNLNKSFVDVSENLFSNTTISGNFNPNSTNLFQCCSNINDMDQKWQPVDYYCADKSLKYDRLYINCGGNKTSFNGSLYEADLNPDGGSTFFLSNNKAWAYSSMGGTLIDNIDYDSNGGPIYSESTIDQYMIKKPLDILLDENMADNWASLYTTARASPVSLKYYGFCLKDGEYTVKLHFAEIVLDSTKTKYSPGIKRRRIFDVEIQGQKVLTDFNIEEAAGDVNKAVVREFKIHVNNSPLEIHLYWSGKGSSWDNGPLISAISLSPVPKKHRKLSPLLISGIVGSVPPFILMILGLCWKLGWLGGKQPNGVELYPGGVFNFQQIKAATNDFASEKKIGQGGFGAVYRGKLLNGTEIAVKQLSRRSKQGVREFINEMGTIYALKHPNLVRLMGCCAEEHQLLLVYEYMENNSLGHALFDPGVKAKLDWKKRVKICLDVARGLVYLHEECKLKLIHGDIKPTNILLDKDFNAKISDFGFARPDERETTHKNARPGEGTSTPINVQVKGTQGYIAPECMKAKYSPKVDVYSFGILTLEIISGKQSSTPNSKGQTIYLLDMAYDYLRQGNPLGLLDPSLGSEYNYKDAKRIIYLAMQCVSHDPNQRPTMSEVVKILEGKKKIKNILVSIAADDLMMGKATVGFSQSFHSASKSFEGTSDSAISPSISKEIDQSSLTAYYSARTVKS